MFTAISSHIPFDVSQPCGSTDGTTDLFTLISIAMFLVGFSDFHAIRMHFIIDKANIAYCYWFYPFLRWILVLAAAYPTTTITGLHSNWYEVIIDGHDRFRYHEGNS